ncbi:Conserved_hypothetical protein [Hexamita inflata]|uniref:Uncharacterized protein n=1 Tax=Hexamita inflata TaxID=28002 RepID=A0AA86TMN6_9EUKA|nr:Conserved hypothetical protein [Hexamita inflata]
MEFVELLRQQETVDENVINDLRQFFVHMTEDDFEVFTQLIPLFPHHQALIQPIQNSLRMFSRISSFFADQLQNQINATPVFTFALFLALQPGNTNIIKNQRQQALELINTLMSAQTAAFFADSLFQVFQTSKPSFSHLQSTFDNFPDSLSTQIFHSIVEVQPDFAGSLLLQLKIKLDYNQFLQNPVPSLRQAAVMHSNSIELISRRFDHVYQIRQQLCQRIPTLNEINTLEAVQVLIVLSNDKNIYVRKAAFNAIFKVFANFQFKILDENVFKMLIEREPELNDVFIEKIKIVRELNTFVQNQILRLSKMQISELSEFLNLFNQLIKLKHPESQKCFKNILEWGIGGESDAVKKCFMAFLVQFIEQKEDDEVMTACTNKLIDLSNQVNRQTFYIMFKMLGKDAKFISLIQNPIVFKQLIGIIANPDIEFNSRALACRIMQTLVQLIDIKIKISPLIPILVQIVEIQFSKFDYSSYNFVEELSECLFTILRFQKSQKDEVEIQNLQNISKFVIANIQQFYIVQLPLKNFLQITFLENKGVIDKIFGMLSRRAETSKQQVFYVVFCAQLLKYLSDTENDEIEQSPLTIQEIQTTMQGEQTTFLQEYSYLVYSGVIGLKYVDSLMYSQDGSSLRILNLLIPALSICGMVFPPDIIVENQSFGELLIQTFIRLLQVLKRNTDEIKPLIYTTILSIQSLIFNKPSEFAVLIGKVVALLGSDQQINDQIIYAVSQLFNASCIKIGSLVPDMFQIANVNEVAYSFFANIGKDALKQNQVALNKIAEEKGIQKLYDQIFGSQPETNNETNEE